MKIQQTVTRTIKVSKQDLPICCPMPGQALWNYHPQVSLSFDDHGQATCYYCSTQYVLVDQDQPVRK